MSPERGRRSVMADERTRAGGLAAGDRLAAPGAERGAAVERGPVVLLEPVAPAVRADLEDAVPPAHRGEEERRAAGRHVLEALGGAPARAVPRDEHVEPGRRPDVLERVIVPGQPGADPAAARLDQAIGAAKEARVEAFAVDPGGGRRVVADEEAGA